MLAAAAAIVHPPVIPPDPSGCVCWLLHSHSWLVDLPAAFRTVPAHSRWTEPHATVWRRSRQAPVTSSRRSRRLAVCRATSRCQRRRPERRPRSTAVSSRFSRSAFQSAPHLDIEHAGFDSYPKRSVRSHGRARCAAGRTFVLGARHTACSASHCSYSLATLSIPAI